MSNAIRYDPLLVRYLSEELDRLLRGRACASAPYFAAQRVALLPLDRGEALEMDLHPRRGWFRIIPWEGDGYEADALCLGVEAPPDERRLIMRLDAPDRFRSGARRLEVELHTNQWNVLLVSDEDQRIHSALWARRAGERALTPGSEYRPPAPSNRLGLGEAGRSELLAEWMTRLGPRPPEERERELVRGFAWTGTVNAASILLATAGEATTEEATEEALRGAFGEWWRLRQFPSAGPVVLLRDGRYQPYPFRLAGWEAEEADSLLAAMGRVAVEAGAGAAAGGADEESRDDGALLGAARLRLEAALRRVERLEGERQREGEADRLRARADLLLAKLHEVPKGVAEVVLTGWDEEAVRLSLDPGRSAAENAADWYAEARKRARAAERLPGLIQAAQSEAERWREAVVQGEIGALPSWVAEKVSLRRGGGKSSSADPPPLPYHVFRSSGGLEIRVGRSSKANDQLTFGHSSPNDVWLHARSVPGSHVILRWADPEGAPPARDLEEAARLAAFHSKARSSAIVPVDWTRRKYVRKPRGAAPGSVIPQRVRTLFVEPGGNRE